MMTKRPLQKILKGRAYTEFSWKDNALLEVMGKGEPQCQVQCIPHELFVTEAADTPKRVKAMGMEDGSAVKSICCASEGCELSSKHPCQEAYKFSNSNSRESDMLFWLRRVLA